MVDNRNSHAFSFVELPVKSSLRPLAIALSIASLAGCSVGAGDARFWDVGETPPRGSGGSTSASATASESTGVGAPGTWSELYSNYFGKGGAADCSASADCHIDSKKGFKCGGDKATCYAGMIASGNVVVGPNAASSPLLDPAQSPLCGIGTGNMPPDCKYSFSAAAVADIKQWLMAGGGND
jgi:hypothetical protein